MSTGKSPEEFLHRIRLILLGLALVTLSSPAWSQAGSYSGGAFALGARGTVSSFFADRATGIGSGGQFKIGFGKRVNTSWYLDFIQSAIQEDAYRKDYHIGWSVQFALGGDGFGEPGKLRPYVLGGQCFDLTRVGIREVEETPLVFSAAAQAGLGLSYFVTDPFELTLESQYMMHLSKDVHLERGNNPLDLNEPEIHIENGASLSGHLLFTFSANFYFLDLVK